MAKNEVSVKKENPIQDATLLDDLFGMSGAGMENVTAEETMTPRLAIIQALSPQKKKNNGKYIEGAEEGMIFNNVDNTLFEGDEGFSMSVVHFHRYYAEWDAKDRGTLYGYHDTSYDIGSCTRNDNNKLVNAEGHVIEDTYEFFVVVVTPDGEFYPAVISMCSTQIPKAKKLNSQIKQLRLENSQGQSFTPPAFVSLWSVKTSPESKGENDWFGWDIERQGLITDLDNPALLGFCKDFYQSVSKGEVKVASEAEDIVEAEVEPAATGF